ncbi:oligosaccharide flippase family protein [Deinococcus geothermalis]|uniref:oligosaccharide flippase family protein n=1 Tax=Deinococcus geothermalis TaxID=68909 RepID=UPI0018DE0278|nr:oligosaccharide flippase family protein [Deinococcus geothermalis]
MTTIKSTAWLMGGYLVRQGTQLISFILLTRTIGADGFGAFTAVLALALIFSPFVEMGGYSLVIRDIERGDPVPDAAGHALAMSLSVIPVALAFTLLLKPYLLPTVPIVFVVCVVVAELLANRALSIAAGVHVATKLTRRNAVVESAMGSSRLLLTFLLSRYGGDLLTWGWLYLGQAVLGAVAVLGWVRQTWRGMTLRLPHAYKERLLEGVHFAFGTSAQAASTELDKVMLGRLASLQDTGIFSAAQRLTSLSNVFLFSLLSSLYPRFFELGRQGHGQVRAYALRLLPVTLLYGLVVFGFFWLLAPYVGHVLGREFAQAGPALRWLAGLALLNAIHYPLADALTGAGLQHVRTRLYLITLLLNVALNFWLIPRLGWLGAACATLISQSVLIMFLLLYRTSTARTPVNLTPILQGVDPDAVAQKD